MLGWPRLYELQMCTSFHHLPVAAVLWDAIKLETRLSARPLATALHQPVASSLFIGPDPVHDIHCAVEVHVIATALPGAATHPFVNSQELAARGL